MSRKAETRPICIGAAMHGCKPLEEVGSGNGDLLAVLKPSYGLGIDISGQIVRLAA